MITLSKTMGAVAARMTLALARVRERAMELAAEEDAQGTTEYAILVGVLVVIAIFAVAAMRGKVQSLWDAIVSGIDGL